VTKERTVALVDQQSLARTGAARAEEASLCVIVPTRNEAGNVAPLLARLEKVLPDERVEVLFVDDSEDGTERAVEREATRCRRRVGVIHRPPDERRGGLGGAVVDGIRATRTPWICVMDGDLQHPPEVVAALWAQARRSGADIVVASRYQDRRPVGGLGAVRRLVSRVATAGARLVLPRRLRAVSDPLSGFFLVRRAAIDVDRLRPKGFKILLEILSRTPGLRAAEVSFEFGVRHAGESKASVREGLRYLSQLWRLRLGDMSLRFTRFGLVGLSGLLVNTLFMAGLTGDLGIWYLLSAVIATQASTIWNFCLCEAWVFGSRRCHMGMGRRFVSFWAMNNSALLLRGPLLVVLTSGLGINYLISNLISLLSLTVLRFGVSDSWIWAETEARRALHRYSVHGVVTVESSVALPELARFEVAELDGAPTIVLRIGRPTSPERGGRGSSSIRYRELLGTFGFAARIDAGESISVVASPLVGRSPHVLYTNLVEPILRWAVVRRGYALVHAACVAVGQRAFLVTARTDTGKTTTVLLTLRKGGWRFLSDDLTLVAPDGRVLAYPKPLTISRHTVHALGTARLSRLERVGLVLQSRIHSRTGRRAALSLARRHVPAATLNAIVQILVPPPKYHVERLVPDVEVAREATLAGMLVIERGEPSERAMREPEALRTLLVNCDDAYGFPPYRSIAPFLRHLGGQDLGRREQSLIRRALAGRPATLVSSDTMDWASRLPMLVVASPSRGRATGPGSSVPLAEPGPVAGKAV
jgi:glycosyltransferase involved in cell wall biosynthesis